MKAVTRANLIIPSLVFTPTTQVINKILDPFLLQFGFGHLFTGQCHIIESKIMLLVGLTFFVEKTGTFGALFYSIAAFVPITINTEPVFIFFSFFQFNIPSKTVLERVLTFISQPDAGRFSMLSYEPQKQKTLVVLLDPPGFIFLFDNAYLPQ
jgi:hypothetical protein